MNVIKMQHHHLVTTLIDAINSVGSQYWKSARKIKAITKYNYERMHVVEESGFPDVRGDDSDDDFIPACKSKKPCLLKAKSSNKDEIEGRVIALEETIKNFKQSQEEMFQQELATCKESMNSLEAAVSSRQSKLTEAMNALDKIEQNLNCIVCKSVAREAFVIFPCCKLFGSCYSCICDWLEENPSCPHCRAPMCLSTCTVVQRQTR